MIYKIQVVTVSEDGCQETLEIACVERTDLKPETLGLTLAEDKMILNDLQQIVVERQVLSSLLLKQACPDCGQRRRSKGNHTLSLRTVFGQLTVRSPRCTIVYADRMKPRRSAHWPSCCPHAARVAFPGDQVGLAHELRDDVETLARRAADRRAHQYVHYSPAHRGCSGAVGARNTFRRWYPDFHPQGQAKKAA
jgi:hypothetical protein